MAIVTPTDRPRLVRNHCVIEVFGGVFVLAYLDFYVSVGAFVKGLSQISSFFSLFSPGSLMRVLYPKRKNGTYVLFNQSIENGVSISKEVSVLH